MSNENENLELPTNDKEINNKDDSNDNNNNYNNQLEIVSYPFADISRMSSVTGRDLEVITDTFPFTISFDENPSTFQNMSAVLYNSSNTVIESWTWNTLQTYISGMDITIPSDATIEAIKDVNVEPIISPIRGGTDGAEISYMGIPCPNIGTGGHNFHSIYEYVCVEDMEKTCEILSALGYKAINVIDGFGK